MIFNPASVVLLDALWIVPFERNPRFIGREDQLVRLKANFFSKDHTTSIVITDSVVSERRSWCLSCSSW
jgi:hypothetical protein